MEANEEVKEAVNDLLGRYVQAYWDKDLEGMMKLFIQDEGLVVIGTGDDEWIQGTAELKDGFQRDMDQANDIKVKFRDVSISAAGSVAWASTHMSMEAVVDGQQVFLSGRLSAVMEERGGKWFFTHLHYSLPATEQEKGDSWPD
jgi:ketosteroid isomerase-like protein